MFQIFDILLNNIIENDFRRHEHECCETNTANYFKGGLSKGKIFLSPVKSTKNNTNPCRLHLMRKKIRFNRNELLHKTEYKIF